MNKLDTHERLSIQDYGPWLDRVTLYEQAEPLVAGTRYFLHVEGGYSKPYENEWYELSKKPAKKLSKLFTCDSFAGTGDTGLISELAGVEAKRWKKV